MRSIKAKRINVKNISLGSVIWMTIDRWLKDRSEDPLNPKFMGYGELITRLEADITKYYPGVHSLTKNTT